MASGCAGARTAFRFTRESEWGLDVDLVQLRKLEGCKWRAGPAPVLGVVRRAGCLDLQTEPRRLAHSYMSYIFSLNSLKDGYMGDFIGD